MARFVERKTCQAPDGVTIVYSAAGGGDTALVFVHGGMADRSFFDGQVAAFADRYRVIAVDLPGHGESGTNRTTWGIPEFGADIEAVVEAEGLRRVVLLGNSLGGPAAVEAALLLPGRVVGVVGIDTFQDLGHPATREYARLADDHWRKQMDAFRSDYPAALKAMVKGLFHPDADGDLVADTTRRMSRTSPEAASAMIGSLAGYDVNDSVRRLTVPLYAINGDLYPLSLEAARAVKPDFTVTVMPHVGHYPMLERADEFDRHVAAVVRALTGSGSR